MIIWVAALLLAVLSRSCGDIFNDEKLLDFKHSLDLKGMEMIDTIYEKKEDNERPKDISLENYGIMDESDDPHSRNRRSNKVAGIVKESQRTGNREELNMRTSTPNSELPTMSDAADIVPIHIKLDGSQYAEEGPLFFAVANHKNKLGLYSSTVVIWVFNKTSEAFAIHQVLPEYAPQEVESFSGKISPVVHKNFLAVSGFVEGNNGSHPTKVSIYEIGAAPTFHFIKIQEFLYQNIRTMKYVEIYETTYLLLGSYVTDTPIGKQYNSPSQLMIKRYDPTSNFFHYHSSLPASGIVDLESFEIRSKTYLAVTNHRDNNGNLDIFSFIYIYSARTRGFEILQYIPTHGALDLEHFVLSNENYIVVGNEARGTVTNKTFNAYSDVYKFNNGKFELIQTLETYGAVKWKSLQVPNCKQDILLFYADRRNDVDQVGVFTFSHDRESFSAVPFSIYHLDNVESTFRPEPSSLATFTVQQATADEHKLYLIVGAKNLTQGSPTYQLSYEIILTDSPLDSFTRNIQNKLETLKKTLETVKDLLMKAKQSLADAVLLDDDDVILGKKTFQHPFYIDYGNFKTVEMTESSILYLDGEKKYRVDPELAPHVSVDDLYTNSSRQNETINQILDDEDLFMVRDKHQNITGAMTFENMVVKGLEINGNLTAESIDNHNLSAIVEDLVSKSKPAIIVGETTFTCDVVSENITLGGTLNDLILETDIVLNRTRQNITAKKTFMASSFVNGDFNAGLINGVDLSSQVFRIDEPATILGSLIFIEVVSTGDATINGKVNDLNLIDVFSNFVTKSTDQAVHDTKVFAGMSSHDDVVIFNKVNNFNLSELEADVYLKSNSSLVYGEKIFTELVTIEDFIDVDKSLNDMNVESFMTKSEVQNITGKKTFSGPVNGERDVNIAGLVDGIDVNDLVTLNGDEEIPGHKIFTDTIEIDGNFTPGEGFTVNNVNLSEFVEKILNVDEEEFITHLSFVDIIVHNSTIKGTVVNNSKLELGTVYDECLHLTGDQLIRGDKTVNGLDVTNNLNSNTINGHAFPDDFAMLSENQEFTGEQVFTENIVFEESIQLNGSLNGLDFQEMVDNLIMKEGNETITGVKTILETTHINGDLVVDGAINDVDLSVDAMLLYGDQTVTATKNFSSLTYDHLNVTVMKDVAVSTTIDGVDLSELDLSGMTITKDEVVTGRICFTNPNYDNSTHYLNNIDIHELRKDIVMLNTDQVITGEKTFLTALVKKHLNTTSTIDGVDVSELADQTVCTNKPAMVTGPVVIERTTTFLNNITVLDGLVDGDDQVTFLEDFVSKSNNMTLNYVTVLGDVHVSNLNISTINGLDIERDIVYCTLDQTIHNFKEFPETTIENLTIANELNGVNLTQLFEEAVKKNEDRTITGPKKFLTDMKAANVSTNLLNGIDLNDMDLVKTTGIDSQTVTGKKTFMDPAAIEAVAATTSINGHNLNDLQANMVYVDRNQTVDGKITFQDGFQVYNHMHVSEDLVGDDGKINGVSLPALDQQSLKANGDQVMTTKDFKGALTFTNLTVDGRINGLLIPDDIMTKSTDQNVNGKKLFLHNLTTTEDVTITGLMNGVNISDLRNNSLFLTHPTVQTISGQKTFNHSIALANLTAQGTVDGLVIHEDTFITLATNQTLTGVKTFVENFESADLSVAGMVADVDLAYLNSTRLLKHTDSTIMSDVIFPDDVYANKDTLVSGFVNGIDLSEFVLQSPGLKKHLIRLEEKLHQTLNRQCNSLMHIKSSLEGAPASLDYFTLKANLPHDHVHSVDKFTLNNEDYLAVSIPSDHHGNECTDSVIMKWNVQSGAFENFQWIPTACARKMLFITTAWQVSYLFVINKKDGCPGITGPSQLFRWNPSTNLFVFSNSLSTTQAISASLQDQNSLVYLFVSSNNVSASFAISSFQLIGLSYKYPLTPTMHSFTTSQGHFIATAIRHDRFTSRGVIKIGKVVGVRVIPQQEINGRGACSITSFIVDDVPYLVVSNDQDYTASSHATYNVGVDIYMWHDDSNTYKWFQTIPTTRAIQATVYKAGTSIYMMVAHFDTAVSVYKFGYELGFETIDILAMKGTRSVEHMQVGGEDIIVVGKMYNHNDKDNTGPTPLLNIKLTGTDQMNLEKTDSCEKV